PIHAKRSILIAGSTSNFVFFLLFLLISLGVGLIIPQMVERVEIINVSPNSSALGILHVNESILKIDGTPIKNVGDVSSVMSGKGVGEKVVLTTESGDKEIVLKEKGKIGITLAEIPKENASLFFAALKFLLSALTLTWFLSFALSVFNLLPLFITDGQRIVYDELSYRLGKRRKRLAMKISIALGIITILLLIANLLPWFGI
ncbi:site-2 protease family protein, partial [Candidatus Micrarchaeota archaeon]|nr:site-2 protease family protein [Candidatus Micrarchaeota archaeon]